MRAKLRQYSDGAWTDTLIITDPLRFEPITEREDFPTDEQWVETLPTVLIDGQRISIESDPETWIERMARMNYTRLRVEPLGRLPRI